MIKAELIELSRSGIKCDNANCDKSELYHDRILGQVFYMKQGIKCAVLSFSGSGESEIYCEGCITFVFHQLKMVLDRNLWAFH